MAYSLEPLFWMDRTYYFNDERFTWQAFATTIRCKDKLKKWLREKHGYRKVRVLVRKGLYLIYARKN